ncbi:MAG TPA: hypothetical protein VH325_02980 [Bryobacteraceae bacterium]|nr:hypothetical protein [Bryobacteraceae bacterium]
MISGYGKNPRLLGDSGIAQENARRLSGSIESGHTPLDEFVVRQLPVPRWFDAAIGRLYACDEKEYEG